MQKGTELSSEPNCTCTLNSDFQPVELYEKFLLPKPHSLWYFDTSSPADRSTLLRDRLECEGQSGASEMQSTQHTQAASKLFFQNEGNPKYKYTRSEKGENGNNHSIRLWELAGEDKIITLTWRLRRQCTTKSKTPCRTLMMVNVYAMTDPITFPTSSTIKRPRPQEQPRINS